jgi:hypothetical protein
MLSSKIRTIIITLIVASSMTSTVIVPNVAQAAPKQTQQEAKKNCEGDFKLFEASVNRMEGALKAGNSAEFSDAKRTAEGALDLYEGAGCDSILAMKLRPMPTRPIISLYRPITISTSLA